MIFARKIMRKKRFLKNHKGLYIFIIFSLLLTLPFPYSPSLFTFSFSAYFLFFSPIYIHMPVSWTFYKYLHEFRAIARKIEKRKGRL